MNVVPIDVYTVIGGDKNGGATLLSPKSGYDTPNGGLQTLLTRKPTFTPRSPSRTIPTATSTATPTPPPPPRLSTGAIVGIAVGGAVALGLIIAAWCRIGRRVNRRREQRHQSQVSQMTGGYAHDGSTPVSPHTIHGPWGHGSPATSGPQQVYAVPLNHGVQAAELDAQHGASTSPRAPSELFGSVGPKKDGEPAA